MEPLVWWVLLFGLIILITALSLQLCFSLLSEKIKAKLHLVNSARNPPGTDSNFKKLTRYQFEKTDVEDLTSIEKNLAEFHPRITFVNEFGATPFRKESTSSGSPRSVKKRKGSLLTDVHESIETEFGSFYSIEDIMEDLNSEKEEKKGGDLLPRRFSLVTEGMRRNSSAALPRKFSLKPESRDESSDSLNYADPLTIETSASIAQLDDQARRIEYEIDYFLGNSKNLKFYELNEKLIRVNLALSELECSNEELRSQKKELQTYIAHCKDKLNSKVA
ncbi:uncharacterized protein LOC109545238 [Dendroctonus ponderosae]|uniref:uncharacterized protein LOC109545238 n=1 Tax=Dendroctonus ponderosae TaxID=77166 RepID=UPI002034F480|nr:uncharacterized protein LOC109545238 [Dendroctonus ponderosae]